MYCPRCSQPQVFGEVRFCPSCGLQLNFVKELLANNGVLVADAAEPRKKPFKLRRKGIRRGAKLMFLSGAIMPIVLMLAAINDSPELLILPLFIFLGGLVQVLYTLLFGEQPDAEMPEPYPGGLKAINHRLNLPGAQGTTIPIYDPQRTNTAEMVRPPSVTEHTTRLLEEND